MSLTGWYDNLVSELQYVRNELNKLKTSGNLIISHVIQITSVVLLGVYCLFRTFYLSQVTSRNQKCAWLVGCQMIFNFFSCTLLCAGRAPGQHPVPVPGLSCAESAWCISRCLPWGKRPMRGRKWWIPGTTNFLEELLKIQHLLLLSLLWVLVLVSSYLLICLLISERLCHQSSWALAAQ